jgi:hypothetical protein
MIAIPASIVLSLTLSLFVGSCAQTPITKKQFMNQCPTLELKEGPEDCPWASLAREWQRTGSEALTLEKMRQDVPELFARMESDVTHDAWIGLWGRSQNYDELAKETIVDVGILDRLAIHLKTLPRNGKIVHAGMEHTYGYLFSTLQTAYGYKRARWVRSDLEDGFGLPRGTLGPLPSRGSLLTNLTYFMGRISLWDESKEQKLRLRKLEAIVEPGLVRYPWKSLRVMRLEERFENHGGDPSERAAAIVALRTDLVEFPRLDPGKKGAGNSHLLIYSIHDPRFSPNYQLITAFPVNQAFVDRTIDTAKNKPNEPIVVRYNAFVSRDPLIEASVPTTPGIGTKRLTSRTLR